MSGQAFPLPDSICTCGASRYEPAGYYVHSLKCTKCDGKGRLRNGTKVCDKCQGEKTVGKTRHCTSNQHFVQATGDGE